MSETRDADLAEALVAEARRAGRRGGGRDRGLETSVGIGVADRALEEAERSESLDLGLRVLLGPRQACVAASDPRPGTLAEMAARAVAIAREAPEDPYCGLAAPEDLGAVPDLAALDLLDPGTPPEPARLEALAREAEDAALAVEGVTQVEQASASWGTDRVTLRATNGVAAGYARSSLGIAVSAIAGTGLGRERDFAAEMRRHRDDLPAPGEIGARAGARAVAALTPRRPPSGRFPVLYDERVAASLVSHLLSAINGSAVARGASWLSEAMGTPVIPAGLSITEDPLIPRGRASRPSMPRACPGVPGPWWRTACCAPGCSIARRRASWASPPPATPGAGPRRPRVPARPISA